MTLIRYPGAKAKLAPQILEHFPEEFIHPLWARNADKAFYVEPFLGSAAIGLQVLREMNRSAKAFLSDVDNGIVCLWKAVRDNPGKLTQAITDFSPTVEAFYELKERDGEFTNTVDTGFRKLALHRLSVSGFGFKSGGPIGGREQRGDYKVGCRWNAMAMVSTVRRCTMILNRLSVEIERCDIRESLTVATSAQASGHNVFAYLDPPYFEKGGELYKHNLSEWQHDELAHSLALADYGWALSYDDHPVIRDLYAGAEFHAIDAVYSNAVCTGPTRRKNREVLIKPAPGFFSRKSRVTTELGLIRLSRDAILNPSQ